MSFLIQAGIRYSPEGGQPGALVSLVAIVDVEETLCYGNWIAHASVITIQPGIRGETVEQTPWLPESQSSRPR
jgi:hypothetical protein